MALIPNRDASTRSNAVGVPPRWMCPSTVQRASLPVRFSISSASCCPIPPSRAWPNESSRSSDSACSSSAGWAPSATTTIGAYLVWNRCSTYSQTLSMLNGFSGMRITFAPPASPACSAIAAPSVSSPPIATSASTPRSVSVSLIRSTPDRPPAAALSASGLVRELPRIVPPRGRIPRTACTSSGMASPSSGPRHPSRNPVNSYPYSCVPRRTSARMTAFSPGQSPPPVSPSTRIEATLVPMSVLAIDAGTTGVNPLVILPDGTVAARGYTEFAQHYPRPGWVEHVPEEIWQATLAACRQALDGAGRGTGGPASRVPPVTCLGITNQRETAVIWDRVSLAAPRPAIVWQDRRTARICDALRARGGQ